MLNAKDENKWKVAKIVNIKYYTHRPTITLRFDGFPTTWNEVLNSSFRIFNCQHQVSLLRFDASLCPTQDPSNIIILILPEILQI